MAQWYSVLLAHKRPWVPPPKREERERMNAGYGGTPKAQAGRSCRIRASLLYIMSSRSVGATKEVLKQVLGSCLLHNSKILPQTALLPKVTSV